MGEQIRRMADDRREVLLATEMAKVMAESVLIHPVLHNLQMGQQGQQEDLQVIEPDRPHKMDESMRLLSITLLLHLHQAQQDQQEVHQMIELNQVLEMGESILLPSIRHRRSLHPVQADQQEVLPTMTGATRTLRVGLVQVLNTVRLDLL